MTYTRRDIGKIALATLPAAKLLAKPNSKFGGVEIGIIISPTNFRDMPLGADEILKNLVELGISGIEMQDVRVETYAGAPIAARASYQGIPGGPGASTPSGGQGQRSAQGGGRMPLTPEQQEAQRKAAEEIKAWRLSASMDKYKALHRMYADAGVDIYAFRLARLTNDMSDDEFAYFFNSAHALGANQITVELPTNTELTQRIGDYATKRKIMMGYHNHTQVKFNSWDTALSQSKYNGINFDVGHFAAAVSQSPIPFIEKHHDRITCLHLKDRKFGANGGQNMPWGQGDTPLKEILAMVKKEKYKFPAGIELEYRIPEGSSTMAELSKCLQFCQDALA
jgi:sugar phosphate isomerase/epimerase